MTSLQILSFDIEEHWRSYESRGLKSNLSHTIDLAVLDRILTQLANSGNRATFFVLAAFAEREPGIVKNILSAGQELASHGYSHRDLSLHTPDSFREDSHRAKSILENIGGRHILGYRAAQWSLTHKTAWSLDILAQLGHTYDSSAFPGRMHRYGWPDLHPLPHHRHLAGGTTIIEFPASRLGLRSWSTQGCGGFYWRTLPHWANAWAARSYGCWYFHAYDLDPQYPLPDGLPLKVRVLKKFGTGTAAERFEMLLKKRRFMAHADVLASITTGLSPTSN